MKKLMLAAAAFAGLATTAPAAAQEEAFDEEAFVQMQAMLGESFALEPLTPEQEARLPLAREIMNTAMPEGALRSAMEGMLGGVFGSLAQEAAIDPNSTLTASLNYYFFFELEPRKAEAALAIIDPDWRAREEAEQAAQMEMAASMMETMEPLVRDAIAELYAIYFTDAQLADIAEFYATPTGQVFASQSFAMSSDPRLFARLLGSREYWQAMGGLVEEAAPIGTPPGRRAFADLSPEERRRLASLTGQSLEDLEYAMNFDPSTWEDAAVGAEAAVEGALEDEWPTRPKRAAKAAE
ncbi:DUF2059 domain-containing protein [Erythrobacter sp. EC-HK427]|uniref:DUF2059 domain-containing protein n=1 Tax=Erythrobacter sp. EC-HK427 TaxID=2038396 RepID=UPI0012525D39|nr:DUF2059 domain-containing protein [Erythrobacter sp. EC-HK427]VVT04430.1 conserved exported hypothetical protein [Erythrobacter sp. EC-HK427]